MLIETVTCAASRGATSLLLSLQLHPRKRISAAAAIQHRYFADLPYQLFELHDGESASLWMTAVTIVLQPLYLC